MAQFLEELPEADWVRPDVTGIHAGFNYLKALPPWLARLPKLEVLRLNNNFLTSPVTGLDQLVSLRGLNLSGIRRKSFPHEFTRLPKLGGCG